MYAGSTTKRNEKYQQGKGRGMGGMRDQVKQPSSVQEPLPPASLPLEVTPNCSALHFSPLNFNPRFPLRVGLY